MFIQQVLQYIAFLVNLAALDGACFSGVAPWGRVQRFAAVEDVRPWEAEIQAAREQMAQPLGLWHSERRSQGFWRRFRTQGRRRSGNLDWMLTGLQWH